MAIYIGLDFCGGDIRSVRVSDLEGCASECLEATACRAFTFNSDELSAVSTHEGVVTGTIFTCQRVLSGTSRHQRNQALATRARAQKTRKGAIYWLDVTMPSEDILSQ